MALLTTRLQVPAHAEESIAHKNTLLRRQPQVLRSNQTRQKHACVM